MTEELSDETLAELREQLEERRADLSNRSKLALEDLRTEKKSGVGDTGDESVEQRGQTATLRLKGREKKHLTKINRALERIEEGSYGECLECGAVIPEERLRARPAAVLCIPCKEEREHEKERKKVRPGLMDDFQM